MTILNDVFAEKRQESLEIKMFQPLKDCGIHQYAIDSYNDFIEKLSIEASHITKNAYLLHFTSYATEFAKDQEIKHLPPIEIGQEIESIMMQTTLRPTTTLKMFTPEYIEAQNGSSDISNDLYTAVIAAPALIDTNKTKDYIGLIGTEVFALFYKANTIWDNQDIFHKDSTTPEEKALYLVKIHELLHTISQELKEEYTQNGYIDELNIKKAEYLLDHIDNLNIDNSRTALESGIMRRYNDITPILRETTPNYHDNIVVFPSLE